ncbi:hypothetical protein HanIR_Chr14g0684001 [Helianthus annuus]|nr:hypothetical protein HanIR_Chr14g0684001 [Helianthus annuus]
MGISKLWDKPDQDPILMRDGQVMSALDFIKSDDTSDVVFADVASTEYEDVVVRGSEHRFEGSDYVSMPNVKGLVKVPASKQCTRRSTRHKGVGQPSTSETIDLGDDLEVAVSDTFKSPAIYEDVLNHFAPPAVRASSYSMVDNEMISKMIMASCNFCALLPEGIAQFRKWMQEYEVFSKKREAMKASMDALRKEKEGFAEKELAWLKKVHEPTQRHEVEVGKLKQQAEASAKEKEELEASLAQLAKDNKWLIEQGFQQVVTYLLHSSEFNSAPGDVYSKLLIHGRHQGYTAGYDAGVLGL